MGHKANHCQTEYVAATWRTAWPWQACAGSDCFLVFVFKLVIGMEQKDGQTDEN